MFILTGVWTLEVNSSDGEHCLMGLRPEGNAEDPNRTASGLCGDGDLSPGHFNWHGRMALPYR